MTTYLPRSLLSVRTITLPPGFDWQWLCEQPAIPLMPVAQIAEANEPPARSREGSRYIRRYQVFDLYDAICFANYKGAILNIELTISWKLAGISSPTDVNRAYNVLMDRFRKFMVQRRYPAYYYAVFENDRKIGYHNHIGLHVPNSLQAAFRRWIKNIELEIVQGTTTGRLFHIRLHKQSSVKSQWQWFKYCVKGLDPSLTKRDKQLGKPDANSLAGVWRRETGYVELQRVRIARSLGHKARRDASYTPKHCITNISEPNRYSDWEFERGRVDRGEVIVQLSDD
ncbi:hypothetical protein ACI7BZ_03205 [Xanthobacter sp. AM11]|uniref:hypothetical protein n=1 Tax=Xanthobacter sp. AM11 TaxID=3380643 RepID=UPI0039BF62F4